jgi:hypothetical protein
MLPPPMSIETYSPLGTPLMELIRRIGCEAAEWSELNFLSAQFVSVVCREMSVCLCK